MAASSAACAAAPSPITPTQFATASPSPSATLSVVLKSTPTPYTGERAALPLGFPVPPNARALPLLPGTAVIGRWEAPPTQRPYDFYQQALPAAGYRITGSAPGGGVAIIRFEVAPGVIWQIEISGDLETALIELWPERD